MANRLTASIVTLSTILLSSVALAQIPTLEKPAHECAEAKIKAFSRMQTAMALETASQADYDVTFYDLDLTIDPADSTVTGNVRVVAKVVGASLTQVDLNLLDNMTVTQVQNNSILLFSHTNDLLQVTLERTYLNGETFEFTVSYTGRPAGSGFGSFAFEMMDGQDAIWSLSEPFGAREWWPCKDIPSDKADSVDVKATVPAGLIVASNGNLKSVTNNGATDTYWWQERYPIATYLVSVAIHPYMTLSQWYHYSPTDSMEVQNYVFASHYAEAVANLPLTVPMIEAFAGMFGEYPFVNEKYGHAEFTRGGGMEHQTITSLWRFAEDLVAHELAHQWWGDYVTCEDFHHIWMNEGFATYSEALWLESQYGESYYHADMASKTYFGAGTVYVPDVSDVWRIFDYGLSYEKGSWVLHMLRHVVGDGSFFDILQGYYNDGARMYGNVTTEQFRDICESISGMDLDWFFHQWIYEEYYPQYSFRWWKSAAAGNTWDVSLTVDQLQTNNIFKMPVDVEIRSATSDTATSVVWDSLATQTFVVNVPFEPAVVLLDPGDWILKTLEEPVAADSPPRPAFALGQNVPNPFNPQTSIRFSVPETRGVTLRVYDVSGRLVAILADRQYPAGTHVVEWDGTDRKGASAASGVYFYKITAGADVATKKMILLR